MTLPFRAEGPTSLLTVPARQADAFLDLVLAARPKQYCWEHPPHAAWHYFEIEADVRLLIALGRIANAMSRHGARHARRHDSPARSAMV